MFVGSRCCVCKGSGRLLYSSVGVSRYACENIPSYVQGHFEPNAMAHLMKIQFPRYPTNQTAFRLTESMIVATSRENGAHRILPLIQNGMILAATRVDRVRDIFGVIFGQAVVGVFFLRDFVILIRILTITEETECFRHSYLICRESIGSNEFRKAHMYCHAVIVPHPDKHYYYYHNLKIFTINIVFIYRQ